MSTAAEVKPVYPQARGGLHALRRLLAAALSACLLVGLAPAHVAAGTHSAAVGMAERRLYQARDLVGEIEAQLDRAAAEFERAWAHSLRLTEELDDVEAVVDRARVREEEAREALRRRVAAAYRAPHADLAMAGAVLEAPDAGTALHVASLVSRMTVRSAVEIDDREAAERRAVRALQQRRVIAGGAAGAALEQQRRGAELQQALARAREQVASAERDVRRAKEAAARIAAAPSASGSAAPIRVDGKVCPVGGPNGFIDSWGYPRSGGRRHQGVDMFAEYSTPLWAVADGVVRRVWMNRLGGLSIDLLDDNGDRYYYAHLSSAAAVSGQRVRAGDVIGAVGDSGNARGTPPHLHWQYHPGDGPPVNPYPLARGLCR